MVKLIGKSTRRRWRRVAASAAAMATVVLSAMFVSPVVSPVSAATGSAPRIPTPENWQFTAGGYSVFTVTAIGSPTPTFSVSGPLPPGIQYHATSLGALVFFGTPPASIAGQSYTVTITATNGVSPNAVQHLFMTSGTTATTTSVSASPNPAVGGRPIGYTARVSPPPSAGGDVTIYRANGSPLLGCIGVPVGTAGTATCGNPYLQAGTYDLYATFSGFRQFLPSRSTGAYRLLVNPAPPAYWLATTNGRVFSLAGAGFLGNANTATARGIAANPDGKGYYVVGAGGGVFAFGTARFFGSVPGLGKRVNNIVDIVPTPDGRGYYVVGSDGGVFTFGDARFRGSVPGLGIRTEHVVAMVASPTGAGYMLVGWDGGVFTFGDVKFYGSIPGLGIHIKSIRDAVLSSTATGYALVGADGGVFKFGSGVRFYGSLPGIGVRVNNIVGIGLTPDDGGYLMAGSDGRVYAFGNAKVQPEPSGLRPNLPVTAIATVPAPRPTIGLAQGVFQGMQGLLPQDRFAILSASSYASPYDIYNNNPLDSSVTFRCLTCGQGLVPYAFSIQWFRSHADAIGWAVTKIKLSQSGAPGQAYAPQYVAGNAVMGPQNPTPWPPPDRMVRAFGQAVGQPVITVTLP